MDGVQAMQDDDKVEDQVSNNNNNKGVLMRRSTTTHHGEMVLRVMGLAFTLVAALVAGVDHETRLVPITLIPGLRPVRVSATAKWQYLSSSVYFLVANVIACSYSAASLILSLRSGDWKNSSATTLGLIIGDLTMVALLFSANGAAAAVGVLGLHGNSHAHWRKVCNIFKKFCRLGAASITISMLGSFAFLLLVVFATLNLHKKSKY